MAKLKYNDDFVLMGEDLARRGLTDQEIAKSLGISKTTFYRYCQEHRDFWEAIKKGKAPVDVEVENIVLKKIRGYEYEETTVEYKPDAKNEEKPTPVLIRKTKKHAPPDGTSAFFWLKNRRPELWNKERTNVHHTDDSITVVSKVPRGKDTSLPQSVKPEDKKE